MAFIDVERGTACPRTKPAFGRAVLCGLIVLASASGVLGCRGEGGAAEGAGALPGETPSDRSPELETARSSLAREVMRDGPALQSLEARASEQNTCCTSPGQIAECWLADAMDDGVTCESDADCPSGACDRALGVCACTMNAHCREGECTSFNLCGPSFCNGVSTCSCAGGCVRTKPGNTYAEVCASFEKECCEGEYPIHPSLREGGRVGAGFCSNNMDCGRECNSDEECAEDGDLCTIEACELENGICYQTAVSCDDGNLCTDDACDPSVGCVHVNNAGPCDDGDACTVNDRCEGGACAGEALDCDDGNPCTDDACDPSSGCVHVNNAGPCDDGDACTVNDRCEGGACVGDGRECDDGNPCTDETCDAERGCLYTNNTDACDDGNACTTADVCSGGVCVGGPALDCIDGNVCTDDRCDPAVGCVSVPNEAPCDDGDACTVGDVCAGGVCVGGAARVCDDGNVCTDDICDPAIGCRFTNNDVVCDDGNACTEGDRCADGVCAGAPVVCDDGNVCTDDRCDTAIGCVYTNNSDGCDDGNRCSTGDRCVDGVCVGVVDCDDGNPCTDDLCDPEVGCWHTFNTADCDDGNACTVDDVCAAGVCRGVNRSCGDGNPCTDDTCDPSFGCVWTDNDDICDDGDVCTVNDICSGGVCAGEPLRCDDGNVCTDDACVAGVGCVHTFNAAPCDDRNQCTSGDVCLDGICAGSPISCDDGDACTEDSCDVRLGCVHTDIDPCYDCNVDADCDSQISCNPQPVGCSEPTCEAGMCVCSDVSLGTYCTDYSEATYPPNCYHGLCDGDGGCQPTMHAAENNLCSDAFRADDPGEIDTGDDTYMGAFANTDGDGALLYVTGSTRCAENNYYAGGAECEEHDSGSAIGLNGRDLVYVFRYQTNEVSQFEMYSYIIKVEADYDIGMYIRTDIGSADDCPEGNAPDRDSHSETYLEVDSEQCSYPYRSTPMPPVTEDECRDDGNTLKAQDCCDPCVEGQSCGYKWCKRGYNFDGSSCDMCAGAGGPGYDEMTFKGNCDALWTYPEDPHNCDSATPPDPGYSDYNYIASAVISPHGITTGGWHNVFVFIDGVDGSQGNFYLSVEKRRWWAGPCDRVNDDARVYDVTDVGAEGETFQGTLEGVVNSMHGGGGPCGGYSCTSWSGVSSCHGSSTANEFWPNSEIFKIHRSPSQGSAVYCIRTDETIAGGADLVAAIAKRRSSALTICDEAYSSLGCRRNNAGIGIEWEVSVDPGELYLIELSQYSRLNRVCTPSEGDDCLYRVNIASGPCPRTCVDPGIWYGGGIEGSVTIDGSGFSPSAVLSGSTSGASNDHDIGNGWGARDELWQINVTSDARVRFSGCNDGGHGSFNGQMAIYDCTGGLVAQDDDGCGNNGMPRMAVDLAVSSQPYYLVIDGYYRRDNGPYGIGLRYQ